ncbi:enoyl-CoA hydratase/Enoyl-CoA isomerase/3-hydroxyacyl-CoA dehydrogenase [Trypanosoma grayi]|uniref:enoyl-CoA hydratase/Enoyl-CoA isomerase/3-hydroxyacyl-CoA dehydrogenase n=1 Tax=Trypanosoma grayi TaxID=71804 RepID=UPI0004F491F8|nr:enoyl-CoA hydratase/Enoyl-CoA isomerase/3-hydroxyacyl-CoA dehydrogenase [Trypanosoma grayi]KEG08078.1 enoyl-CoA hydratase/Enoyl-CoA isomerase/3-hydroxyacyl-CoA dehydrogenase [Trypanosoma grayi]
MQRVQTIASQLGHRRYCHLERTGDVAVLILHHEQLNALTTSMRAAVQHYFREAEADSAVRCIIITGAGGAFSCGVDLADFKASALETNYDGGTIPSLATLTNMIESSAKVVVAATHGIVFSGGLELALAAHYRVATPAAIFSFPEVQLGIVPCGGGTQRLPRLIGVRAAVDMIATSKKVSAREALGLGLVDHVTEGVENDTGGDRSSSHSSSGKGAVAEAVRLASSWKKPRRVSHSNAKLGSFLINRAVLRWAEREIRKKAPKDIRAPLLCLSAVRAAATMSSFADGLKAEMTFFMEALESPEAHAMQHLLRSSYSVMGRGLTSLPSVAGVGLSIRRLGVVGCGTVGMGVTLLALRSWLPVTVVELNERKCQEALRVVQHELDLDVANGRLSPEHRKRCLGLVSVVAYDCDLLAALRDVDLVVECVHEALDLKKQVFSRLSAVCPPHCIIATSASSLSIGELAKTTRRPEKVIGMHFIPPSDVTPLLEIVQGQDTDRVTVLQAIAVGRLFRKAVIVSNDTGVCLTTRLLSTALYQAFAMLEEGTFPVEVDRALRRFGFRLGVFAIEDLAGLDFTAKIRAAQQQHGRSSLPASDVFTIPQLLVQEGRLGQKTGRGWYSYERGGLRSTLVAALRGTKREEAVAASWGVWRKGGASLRRTSYPDRAVELLILDVCRRKEIMRRDISEKEIVERIIFAAINEAAKLLQEGAVSSSAAVDVAMAFGYGFPAWKGGLCYYADKFGLANVVRRMRIYNRSFGSAVFPPPCDALLEMATSQQTFRSMWP